MRVSVRTAFLLLAAACSGGGTSDPPDLDPPIPCQSGNCGQEKFRRAVPSRASVLIDGPASGARARLLEDESEQLGAVEAYVDDINGDIDDLFADLEELAGSEPEIAEDDLHRWRIAGDDELDEVLEVEAIDGETFALAYSVGPAGFEPDDQAPILSGEVVTDGDGIAEFGLDIDLDALGDGATGVITIAAHPFDGGPREVWYDFDAVSFEGEPEETSRTTYWVFDDASTALEYVADVGDEQATVFARWDDDGGGRYDHHLAYQDGELGPVDELATACWDGGGAESFDAWAVIDAEGLWYGEIDGDESACEYGPVDGHPDPGDEFDLLPGDGEWSELDFEDEGGGGGGDVDCQEDPFADECPPLCDEDPEDPECIPFCEDEPDDPDCIWYCDWFDC